MTAHSMIAIDEIRSLLHDVEAEDSMAEAGRKILLHDFIRMLEHENGSRTGEDIEDVHQMRVATRRMRSAFRLLHDHYKDKPTRPFLNQLKSLAKHLGRVRDLDVMIDDLVQQDQIEQYKPLIQQLQKKRKRARKKLVAYLDSNTFEKFVRAYAAFLTTPGKAARSVGSHVTPHQVRHVLPTLIYGHLAAVRAYDVVLDDADVETLHSLRIEFKRLRYALAYFRDVLGASANDYIKDVKAIQDYLGRLNDVYVARHRLLPYVGKLDGNHQAIEAYIQDLHDEEMRLVSAFHPVWEQFNRRSVQSKLANALLVLR